MRVLVCGSRDWADREALYGALDRIAGVLHVTEVIHGNARGADTMAGEWAAAHRIPVTAFPADWQHLGRKAWQVRNRVMLQLGLPRLVVAVPLGESRGTWDMVEVARKAGLTVWVMPNDLVMVDALGEGVFV